MDTLKGILYRVERPFWQTDVMVGRDLKVTFCSGDIHCEWYTHVEPADVCRLYESLVDDAYHGGPFSADLLLTCIVERFRSDSKNPYEPIKKHLENHDIPYQSQFW